VNGNAAVANGPNFKMLLVNKALDGRTLTCTDQEVKSKGRNLGGTAGDRPTTFRVGDMATYIPPSIQWGRCSNVLSAQKYEQKYPRFFQQLGTKHFTAASTPPPKKKTQFWRDQKNFWCFTPILYPQTLTAGLSLVKRSYRSYSYQIHCQRGYAGR